MRKVWRWNITVVAALLLLIGALGPLSASGTVSFEPSGYDGGGFINVIAVDPFGSGLVLAGADAGGVQRSTNSGATWHVSNAGLPSKPDLVVASIVFSPTFPGRVFMAAGRSSVPAEGGFYMSTDGGQSWTKRGAADSPKFSGGNNKTVPELPLPHPRSTGTLIALDETPGSSRVYAGTFQDGVMRSNNNGSTWNSIGLTGKYIRSIAIHPNDINTLYVAAYGEGVYVSTNAKAPTPSWSLVSGATGLDTPERIEELKFVGTRLYAVGMSNDGAEGTAYKLNSSGEWEEILNKPCSPINTNTCFKTAFKAIDGYESTQDVLYIGSVFQPTRYQTSPETYESILKSTDGGATWTAITVDPAKVHDTLGGPTGPKWWLADKEPLTMLGTKRSKVSSIAIDPNDTDVLYTAGVQGVWKSVDAGDNWYPYSRYLNVTFNRAVVVDPNAPAQVYTTDADWAFVVSDDRMGSVFENKPTVDNGLALALDTATNPSTVYVSVANQQENIFGDIYYNADPSTSTNWQSAGLLTQTGGKRPLGIAVRQINGLPVIITALEDGGIWRKAGSSWTQVALPDNVMGVQNTKTASISWSENMVYLYDRQTGIWRSDDDGESWDILWAKTTMPTLGYVEDMKGYVAADPDEPTTLYVSAYDGLYRLDDADIGTVEGGQITPVNLSITNPGPLTVDSDGELFVTTLTDLSGPAGLYYSIDQGATFIDISDAYYQANAGFPLDISVAPDGYIYVATFGQGIVVGKP